MQQGTETEKLILRMLASIVLRPSLTSYHTTCASPHHHGSLGPWFGPWLLLPGRGRSSLAFSLSIAENDGSAPLARGMQAVCCRKSTWPRPYSYLCLILSLWACGG